MATAARKYDLYSDAFRADTYATFARMREHDPVVCQPGIDGETPIWWVTRYEDAEAVLLDAERFVRDPRLALAPELLPQTLPEYFAFIDSNMLNRDGDDHRRLRRLVSKAFTPRMVERLRPRIQEIADALIDPVSTAGEMELVSEFAFPLPITVIAELRVSPSPTVSASASGRARWSARRWRPPRWSRPTPCWEPSSSTCSPSSPSGAERPARIWSARSWRSRTAGTRCPSRSCRAWSRS
jgi:cytochrome P450